MIVFNKAAEIGLCRDSVLDVINTGELSGDKKYSRMCQEWFEHHCSFPKTLLTPSCTHALEMAALLVDIQHGDEVIMPSYTFVSTANAFVLRGAKIVFVDIRPDTMNINEKLIEAAITSKTRVIVPVHYAGVSCDMDVIMDIAKRHGLIVVEDAAQAMMSKYNDRLVGGKGHLAAYSFHETKNYTSGGEGGLLIINDANFSERAEILREKGTNRSQFFRGEVDKYNWVDIGSSFLPSELQAAYLWGQLASAQEINNARLKAWGQYNEGVQKIQKKFPVEAMVVPGECEHNAHMYHIKVRCLSVRSKLLQHLKNKGVQAAFHYVPLHGTEIAKKKSRFHGEDVFTTKESERLIRLPIWHGITSQEINCVLEAINSFKEW